MVRESLGALPSGLSSGPSAQAAVPGTLGSHGGSAFRLPQILVAMLFPRPLQPMAKFRLIV